MSIEFGLTMALYGITIVFAILFLLGCTIELLKKAIRSKTEDIARQSSSSDDLINSLERAIISAAIAAYTSEAYTPEVGTPMTRQSERWRTIGRIEELDSRLIR